MYVLVRFTAETFRVWRLRQRQHAPFPIKKPVDMVFEFVRSEAVHAYYGVRHKA